MLYRLISSLAAIAIDNYRHHTGTIEFSYKATQDRRGILVNGKAYIGLRKRPYAYAGLFR